MLDNRGDRLLYIIHAMFGRELGCEMHLGGTVTWNGRKLRADLGT